MARRLFLHIGEMKTATSYIQVLCDTNQKQLMEQGLYWVPVQLRFQPMKDLYQQPAKAKQPPKTWRLFYNAVAKHSGDVLLSNELLAAKWDAEIRKFAVGLPPVDEIRVIITSRDLSRVIPSQWQTGIRQGNTWPWSKFTADLCSGEPNDWFWRRHDLPEIIERWSAVTATDNMTVVTLPPRGSDPKTVVERYSKAVGVDLTGLKQPPAARNTTMGAHSVEYLRRVNEAGGQASRKSAEQLFRRALGAALAESASLEPRFGLTPEQHAWVRRWALETVDRVAESGVRVIGDLADLVPSTEPPSDVVDPGASGDAELLAAAVRGAVAVAPMYGKLRGDKQRLQLRVYELQQSNEGQGDDTQPQSGEAKKKGRSARQKTSSVRSLVTASKRALSGRR